MEKGEARSLYLRIWRENTRASEKLRGMARARWMRQARAAGPDAIKDTPETAALMSGAHACDDRARDAIYALQARGGLLLAVLP